jgi:hypothetical protein
MASDRTPCVARTGVVPGRDGAARNVDPQADDEDDGGGECWLLSVILIHGWSPVMLIASMLVLSLVIGWFVRPRLTACVAYLAAFSLLFTFQSVVLLAEWAGGDQKAFGAFPDGGKAEVWSYGAVNLAVLAVGVGLLTLTGVLASRRRGRGVVAEPQRIAA